MKKNIIIILLIVVSVVSVAFLIQVEKTAYELTSDDIKFRAWQINPIYERDKRDSSILGLFPEVRVGSAIFFTPIEDFPHSEGVIYYDSDDDTFVAYNAEADISGNMLEELWMPVRNNTGSTIFDGTPVYVSGAIGQRPTIALTDADLVSKSKFAGLTTHDIENNTNGYITTNGGVHGLDTDGSPYGESWSDGDELFISRTEGELTNIMPDSANIVCVGYVSYSHTALGAIEVQFYRSWAMSFRTQILYADSIGLGDVYVYSDAGTPEGSKTANVGSLYLRTDGGANTVLYIKESGAGNTGWVAK